jgi:hypothetical protein
MPYTTIVTGTTITTSWANANVRDQVVTPFADTAARAAAITAPIEGMVVHINDLNTLSVYSGTAWAGTGPMHGAMTAYTPGLAGVALGNGTITGRYSKVGRHIFFKTKLTFGSTTAVTAQFSIGLPTTAETTYNTEGTMWGFAYDSSAAARYTVAGSAASTSSLNVFYASTGAWAATSATVPFTWGTNDILFIAGTFEEAADS